MIQVVFFQVRKLETRLKHSKTRLRVSGSMMRNPCKCGQLWIKNTRKRLGEWINNTTSWNPRVLIESNQQRNELLGNERPCYQKTNGTRSLIGRREPMRSDAVCECHSGGRNIKGFKKKEPWLVPGHKTTNQGTSQCYIRIRRWFLPHWGIFCE